MKRILLSVLFIVFCLTAFVGCMKWDYGEKSPNAKLTNAEAEAIRVAYHAGGISQEKLAQQYGVSRQTVSDIINYKKYIR